MAVRIPGRLSGCILTVSLARAYHDEILSECGPVIAPAHPEVPGGLLSRIYEIFRTSSPLEEHALSDYITRILNSLLFSGQSKKEKRPSHFLYYGYHHLYK